MRRPARRRTKEEWPDQWPAVVDELADPVAGDEGDAAAIRPLLKQTQLERLPLALAYDADVHGWSARAYHKQARRALPPRARAGAESSRFLTRRHSARSSRRPPPAQLDGMGACVILAKTEGGAVAGGYNPKGVLGYGKMTFFRYERY